MPVTTRSSKRTEKSSKETSGSNATKHGIKKENPQPKRSKTESNSNPSGHKDHKISPDPSNILEKGIINFFCRGRVEIDHPKELNDIARSYIILRPIPPDSSIEDKPLTDAVRARLLALPKKTLPKDGQDRFMAFVEKCNSTYDELAKEFLESNTYTTKTAGERHQPKATPVGEGVYAITTTGRETHLAYITTLPERLGEVQNTLGVKSSGSFIISSKNPKYPGPAYASLPKGPGYPDSVMEEDFKTLRWVPTKPYHMDYTNAQILMIGEKSGLDKATQPMDNNVDKDPKDVMHEMEREDLDRMQHMSGDQSDAIYADLRASSHSFPKLQTAF